MRLDRVHVPMAGAEGPITSRAAWQASAASAAIVREAMRTDAIAAQVIFNESDIEIWQVPADAYRQMLFSTAELEDLGARGPLGDSPLVTLTALVPPFMPDPASSRDVQISTPTLMSDGSYAATPQARAMRVYTSIDAGLTFRDMLARFRAFSLARNRVRSRA